MPSTRADAPPIFRAKAEFFRFLGHPARIRALEVLRDGEKSVGELQAALDIDSGGMSQHLTAMRRQGILESRRAGTNVYYAVKDPVIFDLLEVAKRILTAQLTESQTLLDEMNRAE